MAFIFQTGPTSADSCGQLHTSQYNALLLRLPVLPPNNVVKCIITLKQFIMSVEILERRMIDDDGPVVCVLCQRSEETNVTGPLSTQVDVTAHQNCLLYSSGIYCQNSPEFDDLFGFAVEDVKKEEKRGYKLRCAVCKVNRATVGCEVKRCKSSYHYPCAVEHGAEAIEDEIKGRYVLYCSKHRKIKSEVNTPASSSPRNSNTSKALTKCSTKVICLVCDKREENISLDSLNDDIVKLYCQEHKPQSYVEKPNGKDEAAGLAPFLTSLKRKQSSNGRQDKVPSKVGFKRKISSSSDDEISFKSLTMFAPVESEDEEDSKAKINTPEPPIDRNDLENVCASTPGNECQSQDNCEDADETDISMAESQSLLLPVTICMESESSQMTGSSLGSLGYTYNPDPQTQSSSGPHASSTDPADHPHSPVDAPPNPLSSLQPSPSFSVSLPSVPKANIDSASFWKDFNEAGRTKAIFSDFIDGLNDISDRIQSNQASQEDYDMALRVMEASGSLAVLVAKQDEEIKKKKVEVQIEEAAMKRIMSAMGR